MWRNYGEDSHNVFQTDRYGLAGCTNVDCPLLSPTGSTVWGYQHRTCCKKINDEYCLVPEQALGALTIDISLACNYLKNQQLQEMSRAGYWKFKALSPFEAKQELDGELGALGA
jgi:hypothetical protein